MEGHAVSPTNGESVDEASDSVTLSELRVTKSSFPGANEERQC